MKETVEQMESVFKLLNEIKMKVDNVRQPKQYYRNGDLKKLFGLSDNTIITYRDKNIIPFTKLGEIYYYSISEIDAILKNNSNNGMVNYLN